MFTDLVPMTAGLCLAGSCFLAVSAYSLRNFSRSRLQQICRDRQQPDRFGEILRDDEDVLLASELAGCALLLAGLACFSLQWRFSIAEVAGQPWVFALELTAVVIIGLLVLTALPWGLSQAIGESWLYRFWPLLRWLPRLARPLLVVADRLSVLLNRLVGREIVDQTDVEAFTEELQSVVDEGEREGVVEMRHGRMIQRLMEIHEEDVVAAMTPRTEIVSISETATFDEARQLILESGHSRLPVVGDSLDDLRGILYARDLLKRAVSAFSPAAVLPPGINEPSPEGSADYLATAAPDSVVQPPFSLVELVRDPLYIPESTSIETLLEQMKSTRTHVAMVLDEYGGVTGLVTLEDLLEEIVGSIEDEFDERTDEQVRRVDERTLEVDARVHVDDLNEQFHYELPEEEDFDTVGGFIFSELGRIPAQGETLRWRNLEFTVLEADKRRILKLRIVVHPALAEVSEEA